MDKKITPQQIEILYAFTRKHYVEYYDLQTELVDHLANAIETRWAVQPELGFEEALGAEFKKFGIFGFTEVVERRQVAMQKRYYKLIWGYAKDFIRLPKILLSFAAMAVVYQILLLVPYFVAFFAMFILVFFIVRFAGLNKKFKKQAKATGKRWMFQENIYRCAGAGVLFGPVFQLGQFHGGNGASHILAAMVAFLLTAYCLYSYIVLFIIPARAEEHLSTVYPEYKLETAQ